MKLESDNWLSKLILWSQKLEKIIDANEDKKLSEIAYYELSKINFSLDFDQQKFIDNFFKQIEIPKQAKVNSQFGEPPFTIYYSEKNNFYVEVYFWEKIHTTVHDHGFQGAFQVIKGKSLESTYSFIKKEAKDNENSIGELTHNKLLILAPGITREIKSGNGYIHRVLHLEPSSASLIIRSIKDSYIQKSYLFSQLSTPSWPKDEIVLKLRALDWILQKRLIPSTKLIEELLYYGDLWKLLSKYEHARKYFIKLLFLTFDESTIIKTKNNIYFDLILNSIEEVDEKIILTVFESLPKEQRGNWLKENLSISYEHAVKILKDCISKIDLLKDKSYPEIEFLNDIGI